MNHAVQDMKNIEPTLPLGRFMERSERKPAPEEASRDDMAGHLMMEKIFGPIGTLLEMVSEKSTSLPALGNAARLDPSAIDAGDAVLVAPKPRFKH